MTRPGCSFTASDANYHAFVTGTFPLLKSIVIEPGKQATGFPDTHRRAESRASGTIVPNGQVSQIVSALLANGRFLLMLGKISRRKRRIAALGKHPQDAAPAYDGHPPALGKGIPSILLRKQSSGGCTIEF